MEFVTADRSDDDLLTTLHAIRQRSDEASQAFAPPGAPEEFMANVRSDIPGERQHLGVALLDGEPVGLVRVFVWHRENLDKCWAEIAVDPPHRGKGAGTGLLAWAEGIARAEGRRLVIGEVFVRAGEEETDPDHRWAQHRGCVPVSRDVIRVLRLPAPEGHLERLAAEAAPHHADYDIQVYAWGVPEELRPGLCAAANRLMVDAPTGDVEFEADSRTPEDYAELLEFHRRSGNLPLTAVAVHRETGVVAAYTDLLLPDGNPEVAHQMGTLVVPEHRGHRLGMAVKAANLLAMVRDHPGRRAVRTQNAEDNPYMVQINVDLGFEVVEECLVMKRVLAG